MTLLLALALLAQERAEETFKKIEAKIEAARTISLRFKIETFATEGRLAGSSEVSGPLWIKNPRKARFEFTGVLFDGVKNHEQKARFVTDGENVLAEVAGERRALPKNIKSGFKPLLARCGVRIGWAIILVEKTDANDKPMAIDLDLAGRFTLVRFRHGEDDGASKTLTYTLRRQVQGKDVDVPMKIWYDPKTLHVTKRSFVEPDMTRTTETYSDIKLGADIGDDKFEVTDSK